MKLHSTKDWLIPEVKSAQYLSLQQSSTTFSCIYDVKGKICCFETLLTSRDYILPAEQKNYIKAESDWNKRNQILVLFIWSIALHVCISGSCHRPTDWLVLNFCCWIWLLCCSWCAISQWDFLSALKRQVSAKERPQHNRRPWWDPSTSPQVGEGELDCLFFLVLQGTTPVYWGNEREGRHHTNYTNLYNLWCWACVLVKPF